MRAENQKLKYRIEHMKRGHEALEKQREADQAVIEGLRSENTKLNYRICHMKRAME